MIKPTLHLLLALLLAPLAALNAAELRLPSIFSDHMVLQSATAVPVWGWADAGEQIVVEFAGQTKSTTANADGKWTVKLDALEASAGAREMVVQSPGRKRSVKVADVIVGEVWAGGGQSNMEFDMKAITSAGEEIEASANPTLRQFHVLKNPSSRTPADDVQGFWTVARPGTTEDFIAAGYYFAKSIQRELKTPVGLIKVCWGGSKVEPWISPESLATVPEMAAGAKNMDALSERNKSAFREWLKQTKPRGSSCWRCRAVHQRAGFERPRLGDGEGQRAGGGSFLAKVRRILVSQGGRAVCTANRSGAGVAVRSLGAI
jgi:sialate O-acetylesterase